MNLPVPYGEPPEMKKYTGAQRASALMLALGRERSAMIWEHLSVDEVKELSSSIAELGRIPSAVVEHVLVRFSSELSGISSLHGSYTAAERLLEGVFTADQVKEIMEEVRGPSGRTIWDKLSNVSETVLASYLRHEYPQTVAVVLHKLKSGHAARVIAELPPEMSVEVIMRMLGMDSVQKEVIEEVEALDIGGRIDLLHMPVVLQEVAGLFGAGQGVGQPASGGQLERHLGLRVIIIGNEGARQDCREPQAAGEDGRHADHCQRAVMQAPVRP